MRAFSPFRIRLIFVLSLISGSLSAQNIEEIKTWSVEAFAQKMTDQMTPRVPLDEEEVSTVHKINLKFAGELMPVVKGSDDVKSKVALVKDFDVQRSKELALFLSPEQMRQVRQIQAENRKKMKQEYVKKNL